MATLGSSHWSGKSKIQESLHRGTGALPGLCTGHAGRKHEDSDADLVFTSEKGSLTFDTQITSVAVCVKWTHAY